MANRKDQLVADVAFVFEECARLNNMANEGRFAHCEPFALGHLRPRGDRLLTHHIGWSFCIRARCF